MLELEMNRNKIVSCSIENESLLKCSINENQIENLSLNCKNLLYLTAISANLTSNSINTFNARNLF